MLATVCPSRLRFTPFQCLTAMIVCCAMNAQAQNPISAPVMAAPIGQQTLQAPQSASTPNAANAIVVTREKETAQLDFTENTALPTSFVQALAKVQVPAEAASVWVQESDGHAKAQLNYRANIGVSPASVMKLVTTYAALDTLGPAYTWRTQVYLDGEVSGGSLRGNLYIKGGGDPKLVMERVWLLLREIQQSGIQVVLGDIVLDHSAFDLPAHDPGEFDGEPLRPYNAAPDALLINFKSVVLRFMPEPQKGIARVLVSPPMADMRFPASVPLLATKNCPSNWRSQLQLNVDAPDAWKLNGNYPSGCGTLNWPVAYPDPSTYANKVIEGMWRDLGGSVTGRVRSGTTPAGLRPFMTEPSQSLTEIIRDVNKYSNNVMADHVFLAIGTGKSRTGTASYERSRAVINQWWHNTIGNPIGSLTLDNGSGLSRTSRVSAQGLGRMLNHAWQSSVMPELVASLPATGVDGTMRRSKANGSAHLKTGTLRDVTAIAGYVHADNGKRYTLVAIINHPNAPAARSAFDTLIDWVAALP